MWEETAAQGVFLFRICVSHISATGTPGAHLDIHICVYTFYAARNCESDCVIKQLECTIIRCARDSSWCIMTTYDYGVTQCSLF